MQLPNRLSQLLQKQTDRLLKDLLSENPDVLKSYVNGGLAAVGAVLAPINVFMRHLLTVQGLDPDAVPGEKQRALIRAAFNSTFENNHEKDYDDDYDVSWVHKKYNSIKDKFNVTEDKFMALTDLSKLDNAPPVLTKVKFDELVQDINPVAPESEKRELPLVKTYMQDEIQALKEFVETMDKHSQKAGIKTSTKKANKGKRPGARVRRVTSSTTIKDEPTTLEVKSDRVVRPSSKKLPARNLKDLTAQKKEKVKAIKEATPEFQAELKAKLAKATELTSLMIEKGLCRADDQSRKDQIESMLSWTDNNFDALERVINKYSPTKDAVAENKFKGSFRRVQK